MNILRRVRGLDGPTFTKSAGLSRLQTSACASARHPIRDSVGILVGHDVILEGSVPFRLTVGY